MGQELQECANGASAVEFDYHRLHSAEFAAGDLGIAILVAPIRVVNGSRTDIDADGVLESYRTCTSSEGVHLTVWAGEALRSRRVWHDYVYLGYDVEPACVEADFMQSALLAHPASAHFRHGAPARDAEHPLREMDDQ